MTLNSQTVKWAVAALVLAGAATFGFQSFQEKKQTEGRTALYSAEKIYQEELKSIPEAERGSVLDVKAKFPRAIAEFEKAQTTGTDQTKFESAYRLAQLHLSHQSYEGAMVALQAAEKFASGSFEKTSVAYLMGRINEVTQKYAEAAKSYDMALSKGFEGLKEEVLAGLVRTYSKQDQKEKAKTFFEKLKKDFPKSKVTDALQEYVSAN